MRLAVVGLGHIGSRRLRLLRGSLGQGNVVAYDTDPRRCERVAAECECVACADEGEVWEHRPDAVFVCTPPESHAIISVAAAKSGVRALFVEKPLSDTMGDVALERHKVKHIGGALILRDATIGIPTTMVSCNMRFHPGPAQVKAWLAEGRIGEPIWARFETASWLPDWHPGEDWRASYSARVGATLDCGSHELDLALWMLGPATLAGAVTRKAERLGLDCDGMVEMLLDHEAGAISTVNARFDDYRMGRMVAIHGSDGGMAVWNWKYEGATFVATGTGERFNVETPNDSDAMYVAEMRHFLGCAGRGEPTCNPIEQAAETLRMLLRARDG